MSRVLAGREFESIEEANAYLQRHVGEPFEGIGGGPELDPLDQAQDLIYDAWESSSRRERIRLAKRALEISPDCADAYNLLAELKARSLVEARALLEQGVRAGERAIGSEALREDAGDFWGILRTRPYMRARASLAQCLWTLDEREEAVAHGRELLRLNPLDNQGVRDLLLAWLLEMRRHEDVGELLARYEGDWTADWLYGRALWLFRTEGSSDAAHEAALHEALDMNEDVPAYLLGERRLPNRVPEEVVLGSDSEAAAYAAFAGHLWQETKGAGEWLRSIRARVEWVSGRAERMVIEPLSEVGAAALETFLAAPERPEGTLSLRELRGFLFAVASAPIEVPFEDWFACTFDDGDPEFASLGEERETVLRIVALYSEIDIGVWTAT